MKKQDIIKILNEFADEIPYEDKEGGVKVIGGHKFDSLAERLSDGWVNVEDRLPNEDENVWVANDHGVQLVSCMHMKGKFFPYDSPYPIKVTHWRTLPPNPEKE